MSRHVKTPDEIARMKESGKRLASVLNAVITAAQPGVSTKTLDTLAEKLIREAGGLPVFKGYGASYGTPFPASLCTSLNEEVVHGIPSEDRILKEGDLLKLDIGMRFEGMVTDMARTIPIGSVTEDAKRLLEATRESLERGIQALRPGVRISAYGEAVQAFVEERGFSVVRDLVGHGVGHELHEDLQVPNYASKGLSNFTVAKGMTLALEPMINAGSFAVDIAPDDWTFVTSDGKLSAHFEDTVLITEDGAEVITKE